MNGVCTLKYLGMSRVFRTGRMALQHSSCHQEAVEVIHFHCSPSDTCTQLSQENNRKMLLPCVKFLGRQGLGLREDGDENDGNFSSF